MQDNSFKLSKKKIFTTIMLNILMLSVSLFLLFIADKQTFDDPIYFKLFAWPSIIFFSLTLTHLLIKMFDNKPGLIINNQGIIDNSGSAISGLIKWSEIKEIKKSEVVGEKFITIILYNPQKIIKKAPWYKRTLLKTNLKLYKSPIHISANTLNTNFSDLLTLLENRIAALENKEGWQSG